MQKNVSGQKIQLFAFDVTTGLPKTGDAANITAYLSKDYGAVTQTNDTSATEVDATNAKGVYIWDLTQAETNANEIMFTGKSTTANISVVARWIVTVPANFTNRVISTTGVGDGNQVALGGLVFPTGIAQGGSNNTITLQVGTTASQCLPGDWIVIPSGTGSNQIGIVDSFDSVGLVATLGPINGPSAFSWPIANPTNGTPYTIVKMGWGRPTAVSDLWSNAAAPSRQLTGASNITTSGNPVPISTAGNVKSDIEEVKGSGGLSGNGSVPNPWGPP